MAKATYLNASDRLDRALEIIYFRCMDNEEYARELRYIGFSTTEILQHLRDEDLSDAEELDDIAIMLADIEF